MDIHELRKSIAYPTRWTYKLIGQDASTIQTAVAAILAAREFELVPSKVSSGGRYGSFTLVLVVSSEEERLEIFAALAKAPGVAYVL